MGDQRLYAHSLEDCAPGPDWELLAPHLLAVAGRASAFAASFGGEWARAAGLLHDIGKASDAFQRRIRGAKNLSVDHSTAGAREAVRLYGFWGKLIAFAVAGHHAGLADGAGESSERKPLAYRLDESKTPIENYARWRECVEGLPDFAALKAEAAALRPSAAHPAFTIAFFTRMIFSALVDADFLATEDFYNNHRPPARGGELRPEHLILVRERTEAKRAGGEVNALRAAILDHAVARAALPPGLFTLTVPTGGGKTLTSLRFALEHAAAHGLRRVVYVIPFTSIVEQTAAVFRDEMGLGDDAVLEHHSSFDWDGRAVGDAEAGEALAKLRRDTENWDAPIVVTTAVQFWESLFAARTRPCRKLHNLARSVIVLDEAQTLPVRLLLPCLAALEELTRNYGATAVLCTATQPALAKQDRALPAGLGLDIAADRELAPEPRGLYERLKRVRVQWMRDKVTDETIAARFAEAPQMLCIVNSRRHARDLFERIRPIDGARHLTTLMCARHRRGVLADVRKDLALGRPVRLVATSLIEAGVDVSFPEVWRAAAGLDSVAQAAGRCNRSGELGALGEAFGRTVVFEPADAAVPSAIKGFYQAARPVLRSGADPLGLAAIQAYFRELYFLKGPDALDAATIDGRAFRIMTEIDERRTSHDYPFASIARAFRLIDEVMEPVLIPYDAEAEAALRTLELADRPSGEVLRRLQQYTVSVPSRVRQALLGTGAAQPIRPDAYGERFIRLVTMDSYDKELGVRFDDPTFRSAEGNVF